MRLFAHVGLANWPWGELEPNGYDLIMSDNPWRQEMRSKAGEKKAPQSKYRTMTVEEMRAMPVLDLAADNCILWMWAINPMLPQAIGLMADWGFKFKTAGTWLKTTKNGKINMGTGYILRGSNEPFLIGTRGKPRVMDRAIRGGFTAQIREHSRKPDIAYSMCERMVPGGRYLELFSKTDRKNWTSFGDEAGTWTAGE